MLSNPNFIIINFGNKWITTDPNVTQILNFKFQDIPSNYFASCLIKDRNGNKGIALLPSKIVKQINNGSLWADKDTNMASLMMYENDTSSQFSPSRKRAIFLKERGIFLKSICSDAGVCMAFGQQSKRIKRYFEGFVNFKYAISPVKTIGKPTNNGFIKEVTYKRDDYIANAVLKSSNVVDSDNLLYEYLVGKYINKKCRVFPCFVQTYGWYQYKTEQAWQIFKDYSEIDANFLNSDLALTLGNVALQNYRDSKEDHHTCFDKQLVKRDCNEIDYFFKVACEKSKHLSILIEHIKDAHTLESIIDLNSQDYVNFTYNDLMYILYQIYMPLSTLAEEFTHYDLHIKNILIYEPVKGKYIDYRYEYINGDIVEFKSRYIAKIIDYGRCFFKDDSNQEITGSSKLIYESISNILECNGYEAKGFFKFHGWHSIDSSVRNISHDLLLLYRVKKLLKHPKYSDKFHVERKFKERNEFLYDIFEKSNYYGNEKKLEEDEARQKEQAVEEALEGALKGALKEAFKIKKALEQKEALEKEQEAHVQKKALEKEQEAHVQKKVIKVCRIAFTTALETQKNIKERLSKEEALNNPYEQEFIIENALLYAKEALEKVFEKPPDKKTVIEKVLSEYEEVIKKAFLKARSKAKSQEVLQISKFEYGTPEKLTDGLPEKINNVIDAHNALKNQIMTPICKSLNDGSHGEYSKYSGSGKPYSSLGSLTIYESGIPMKFVPTPPTPPIV